MTTINDCEIINLSTIKRREGNITPVEGGRDIPFQIERIYYLYDVPGGSSRGGHAHKELQQLLVAVMGSFDVILDDGNQKKTVHLDRAYHGLYIPQRIWRELENFSSGGICLVLASAFYDPDEYIYDYDSFISKRSNL